MRTVHEPHATVCVDEPVQVLRLEEGEEKDGCECEGEEEGEGKDDCEYDGEDGGEHERCERGVSAMVRTGVSTRARTGMSTRASMGVSVVLRTWVRAGVRAGALQCV